MLSIESLERPKGCLKVLELLRESQVASGSEIMRSTGLSQSGLCSSLNKLRELDLVNPPRKTTGQGAPSANSLTERGQRVGLYAALMFEVFREIADNPGKSRNPHMPVGALQILVYLSENGHVTVTETFSKLKLCKESASNALRYLVDLGLVSRRKEKAFRRTCKKYRMTEKGSYLARTVCLLDAAISVGD